MTSVVALKDIILDQDVQARFTIDEDRVALFACLFREDPELGDPRLPPVILIETSDGKLILADGFHRVEAARRGGLDFIQATTRPGTNRDAILASIMENSTHGLPLTLAERRRAAGRMLADPEWGKESDRELGRRCGLDNKTVAKLRAEEVPATLDRPRTVRRAGQAYQMKVSPTGEFLSGAMIAGRPTPGAGSVETTSEEIPQMGGGLKRRRRGKSKPKPASAKSNSLGARSTASIRDSRNLDQFGSLCDQWDAALAQLVSFANLLETAEPLVRKQFLKEQPLAAEISAIIRDRPASAERVREPAAAGSAET